MAPTMSLVFSTTVLWSFTAECSLLSPDLLRSDVLRPRVFTAVCSPWDLGFCQIHSLPLAPLDTGSVFVIAHTSLSLSRFSPPGQKPAPPFIAPPSPRRTSCRRRLLLTPRSATLTLGFLCLGQWMGCLLGQWIGCLLGQKWRTFLLGLATPTLSPLLNPYRSLWFTTIDKIRLKPSPLIKPHLLFTFFTSRSTCSFSISVIVLSLLFPQVCSYSALSVSSTLRSYWMSVESVALNSWNPGLVCTTLMIVDTLGSTFVLSGGTLIALVRPFTAVCRFYFALALLEVGLRQIGQRSLLSFTVPVVLVRRGFHSPHLSFTEVIIKGFVPFFSIDIYDYVGVVWEVQSLFRASLPHLGTCCQFLFPKFPLVWSGLDDQVSPVLQGSSSRLMVSSALVAELVALWVALDAVTHEAVGIVFFRSLLVFLLKLYFQSISISSLTFLRWTFKLLLLCYLVLPSHLDVIPPLLIEFEA